VQIIANLVKVAKGQKCHISQDGRQPQSPHRFDGSQEWSSAEENEANRQDGEKPGGYQKHSNKPFLPQIKGAKAHDDGVTGNERQEENHNQKEKGWVT
jgi:hypothetical protein